MAGPDDAFDTGLRPSDVDPDRPRPIDTPWGSFAILPCPGGLRAVQSFCPHLMGPLFQGSVAGGAVTCPWHQWRFDLSSGERIDEEGKRIPGGARLSLLDLRVGPRGTLLFLADRRGARDGP